MSRFSRSEAESRGWQIVVDEENHLRAEKMYNGVNVNVEAFSEGLLLERIAAYEAHLDALPETTPTPVDESGVPLDEAGLPQRTVLVGDELITEAEWAARDSQDALLTDDGMVHQAGVEVAQEHVQTMQERTALEENEAQPEPYPPKKTEQKEILSRDAQLAEVMVLRKDEDTPAEMVQRRVADADERETERVAAGWGIGPHHPSEFGGPQGINVVEDETSEGEIQTEAQAEEAKKLGKEADSTKGSAKVAAAGAKAAKKTRKKAQQKASKKPKKAAKKTAKKPKK